MNIPQIIQDQLVKNDKLKSEAHQSSGKLSAGQLGQPIQWQVLHWLGVPKAQPEPEKLGKFLRGNILEDAIIETLMATGKPVMSQVFCQYRDAIGYLDCEYDGYPIEIKSVTSNEWKRLKQAKRSHILQGALYALSLEKDDFGVLYVKPDTFETKVFNQKTAEWKPHVDEAINSFNIAIEEYKRSKLVPGFSPREFWHSAKSASPYPQYSGFTEPFKLC